MRMEFNVWYGMREKPIDLIESENINDARNEALKKISIEISKVA